MSFGRGSSAGCEDDFKGHESGDFSGAGSAGRHDLPNSLVAVGTANAAEDVDGAGACGEDNFDHVVEFRNLLLAASAESGFVLCIDLIQGIHSLATHPCMRLLLHVCLMGRVVGSVGSFVVREVVEGQGRVTLHGWMFRLTM